MPSTARTFNAPNCIVHRCPLPSVLGVWNRLRDPQVSTARIQIRQGTFVEIEKMGYAPPGVDQRREGLASDCDIGVVAEISIVRERPVYISLLRQGGTIE